MPTDNAPTPLNYYGLKRLGFGEDYFQLTGDPTRDQIQIESLCFRISHEEHEGGMGRFGHFKNYVDLTWNNPKSGSMKRCIWNPWANRMFRKMCEEQELGIAGCTSAGKCWGLGTYVMMYDRSTKPVEQIQPGDVVMGDDGTPRVVQEVHRGHGPMLKVTPRDRGRKPWRCTPNHVMVFRSVYRPMEVFHQEAADFVGGPKSYLGEFRMFRPHDSVMRKILPDTDENHLALRPEQFGFTVEPDGEDDWVGFSVDGNHRFLLADFTVVHNSDPAALYGVASYTMDPTHTLVLVMSTSIKEAKKRIWKTVREYWEGIPHLPGKAAWATNEIRGLNYAGTGFGESTGIYLLAAEQGSEKEAVNKLIGMKAPRTGEPDESFEGLMNHPEFADLRHHFGEETLRDLVPRLYNISQDRIGRIILIIDEATGVAEAVLTAVKTNLKPGNVGHCQVIYLGNPNLPYDTFGLACKPEGGWDKVDLIRDDEWRTESGGLCIRFNGELNPRILEGNDRYSWMLRKSDIEQMEKDYGRDSLFYHRMVLGTWCLSGAGSGIYTPADIELSGAREAEEDVVWSTKPEPCSFLDPAFTAGGDRAFATFGLCGTDMDGRPRLVRTGGEAVKVNINDVNVPPSYQIVRGWKAMCIERGIKPENAGFDSTGGGQPFGDIVRIVWSPAVLGITSAGPASKTPTGEKKPGKKPGTTEPVLAHERFANKATEIWYGAKKLLRSRQISGVTEDLAKELCSRQHAKGGEGDARVVKVESKKIYKDREGKSPDNADSFLGLVELAKTRLGLRSSEDTDVKQSEAGTSKAKETWKALREKAKRLTNRRNVERG